MTDFDILMSPPMALALVEGRKTMTRRNAWKEARPGEKPKPGWRIATEDDGPVRKGQLLKPTKWQKVKPGDLLWVKETFVAVPCGADQALLVYRASCPDGTFRHVDFDTSTISEMQVEKWTPSIFMPRGASRITIEVTETKMEPVQDISARDAIAEGMLSHDDLDRHDFGYRAGKALTRFGEIWRELHGADSWDANPEVVAMAGIVHLENIDVYKEAA